MSKMMVKIGMSIAMLLIPALVSGAEMMRFRHVGSLYMDNKEGGMNFPQGVGCRGTQVIVADSGNGRLLRFSFEGGLAKGGDAIRVTEIPYPETVQISTKGEVFVLDGKQRRIARLSPEGTFKGFVKAENAPGAPDPVPMSFRLNSEDNFYILDVFSGRVLVLDPSGNFMKSVDFPDNYGFISDIEVDSKGSIFLLDSVKSEVYSVAKDAKEFTPLTKSLKEEMNFAVNMAIDGKGFIYIADQNGGGIIVVGPDGSFLGRHLGFGWKDGLLRYPSQICINEKEDIFIADRNNSRVQIFSLMK